MMQTCFYSHLEAGKFRHRGVRELAQGYKVLALEFSTKAFISRVYPGDHYTRLEKRLHKCVKRKLPT